MKSSLKQLILLAIVLAHMQCSASSQSNQALYDCVFSESSQSVQCSQSSLFSDSSFLQEVD